MAVPADCACGARYSLKNQYAGRLLACPACGAAFRAPAVEAPALFDRDIFQLREKHLAIDTKYYVRDEENQPLLYVERPAELGKRIIAFLLILIACEAAQKLLLTVVPFNALVLAVIVAFFVSPRRDIYFYANDSRKDRLLTITQDRVIQFPVTSYTLFDENGHLLAAYRKNRLTDFWRKRWQVRDTDGHLLLTATEDSIILSLLRRLTGILIDIAVFRTNFVLYAADGERVLGEFNRKLTLFDRYTLDLTEDADRTLDRRIALGLGVLLDTGEGR